MTNTIQLTKKDGTKVITGINKDCTMKEVMEFYSNNNFLNIEENQVIEIKFYKGFMDIPVGCIEHIVIAEYNKEAECYLF